MFVAPPEPFAAPPAPPLAEWPPLPPPLDESGPVEQPALAAIRRAKAQRVTELDGLVHLGLTPGTARASPRVAKINRPLPWGGDRFRIDYADDLTPVAGPAELSLVAGADRGLIVDGEGLGHVAYLLADEVDLGDVGGAQAVGL